MSVDGPRPKRLKRGDALDIEMITVKRVKLEGCLCLVPLPLTPSLYPPSLPILRTVPSVL